MGSSQTRLTAGSTAGSSRGSSGGTSLSTTYPLRTATGGGSTSYSSASYSSTNYSATGQRRPAARPADRPADRGTGRSTDHSSVDRPRSSSTRRRRPSAAEAETYRRDRHGVGQYETTSSGYGRERERERDRERDRERERERARERAVERTRTGGAGTSSSYGVPPYDPSYGRSSERHRDEYEFDVSSPAAARGVPAARATNNYSTGGHSSMSHAHTRQEGSALDLAVACPYCKMRFASGELTTHMTYCRRYG